ncbi:MAG: two-component system sensor histidine kinase RstB [Pseudohongiellaceae bacterium]|jgi:two-component system sensor histidine kinase RstB
MFKIFLRLWILVFVPLAYLIFSTNYNPINAINNSILFERVTDSYKGTFYLIQQQLEKHSEAQWPEAFKSIAPLFGHDLRLLTIDARIENQPPLKELNNGEFLIFSDSSDSDVIVKRIPDTDWFIFMMLEESEDQLTLSQTKGTQALLADYFKNSAPENWPTILELLKPYFGFDLQLKPINGLEIADEKAKQLNEIGRTWLTDNNDRTMIYQTLPESELVLVGGPIALPGPELTVFVAIVSIFVGGISLGILLFVLPLWKDLSRLNKAASTFGQGHLNQRAETGKLSMISTLFTSFNTMANQIEKLIKGQRDLTNAIAHDLRTPLSRLSFAFEMLQSEDVTNEERIRYEHNIATGIDTLGYLIQQILTLSRYSRVADITHFASCALAQRLRDEISQHQVECCDLIFELGIEPDLTDREIFVDQRAMIRALNNIVSNAVRYAKTTIRISLSLQENQYILSVEDDGPGIPDTERENVFMPFKQLDNAQREISQEHGLGLAIVQQIAEWHKGTARLEKSLLGGARFEIRWPVSH